MSAPSGAAAEPPRRVELIHVVREPDRKEVMSRVVHLQEISRVVHFCRIPKRVFVHTVLMRRALATAGGLRLSAGEGDLRLRAALEESRQQPVPLPPLPQ